MDLAILLYVTGTFTLLLGITHFAMPVLFDFRGAIPLDGAALKPFRLLFVGYGMARRDVYGIAWVMNHAASYALVGIGVLDLLWRRWLDGDAGPAIALWVAGFWLLRAASQCYLGHRRGDWVIATGFGGIGLIHLLVLL